MKLIGKALAKNTFHLFHDSFPECHCLTPINTKQTYNMRKDAVDYNNNKIETLQDVLNAVQKADLPPVQNRDIISATRRVCEMVGSAPATLPADAPAIRAMVAKIRPAAHGVSHKTWANLLSRFRAALKFAGVIDSMGQGTAMRHPDWAPLILAIANDKRLSCGQAAFANFCAARNISPQVIGDTVVERFLG